MKSKTNTEDAIMEKDRIDLIKTTLDKMTTKNRFLFYLLAKEKALLSNLFRQSAFNMGITGDPSKELIKSMYTWIDIMEEFNFLDDFFKIYPEDKDGIDELKIRYPKE